MNSPKLITYYLPQYHITEINNKAWGPGFTEWTNVARARPNFKGHYQPHIPADLGFYDLSYIETIQKQVYLAKQYGIYGFCFYYYWFSGERVLFKPIENFLNSDIDFNFCICWANENWSKRWDGGNNEVILKQEYEVGFEYEFVKSIKDILLDKRYIKVNGKPLLQIYRPNLFPNSMSSIENIRKAARDLEIGELEIAVVDVWLGESEAVSMKADSLIEFIPHQYLKEENFYPMPLWSNLSLCNADFKGCIVDYLRCVKQSLNRWNDDNQTIKRYRGIIPTWDNTARKQNDGAIFIHSSPKTYGLWLRYLLSYSCERNLEFIFINAWNEWGEGCHLEPDLENGRSYLVETKEAFFSDIRSSKSLKSELLDFIDKTLEYEDKVLVDSCPPISPISFRTFIKSRLIQYPILFGFIKRIRKVLNFL